MENRHEENRERLLREIGEGKPYAVGVAGYSCWFFFDYYENVVWFMELCAEDGKHALPLVEMSWDSMSV